MKSLRDATVVITGASSGIGLATAQAFARRARRQCCPCYSVEALGDSVCLLNVATGCERRGLD